MPPPQRTSTRVSKGVKNGAKLAVLIVVVLIPWVFSPNTSSYISLSNGVSGLTSIFGGGGEGAEGRGSVEEKLDDLEAGVHEEVRRHAQPFPL